MGPTLYHVPRTISSPLVQTLYELDLVGKDVDVVTMSFSDLKTEKHLALNPMGTSPTFQDTDIKTPLQPDGMIIWESGAILDYLLERYDRSGKLHPLPDFVSKESIAKRAKYLQLKQYVVATVYPFVSALFLHTLKPENQQDEKYIQERKSKWNTVIAPILTAWLGDNPYFLGKQISALDFLMTKPLNNAYSLDLLNEFPELLNLWKRLSSRPSFFLAYSVQPVIKKKDEIKEQPNLTVSRLGKRRQPESSSTEHLVELGA